MDPATREADRIREEYRRRDAAATPGASSWLDPVYRLQLQELEWALLDEIGDDGISPARDRAIEIGCGSGYFLSR